MTIRVLFSTAVAGLIVLALSGCQDEPVGPDQVAPDTELAARGGGGGGGGGGNGGGDKEKGDLYADLMIIQRDVNGVPIVYPQKFVDERGNEIYCVQPVTAATAVPNPDYVMGVAGVDPTLMPFEHEVDDRLVSLVPIYAQFQQYLPEAEEEEDPHGVSILADDELDAAPGPCDIILFTEPIYDEYGVVVALDTIFDYNPYAHEVELERLNMARAPSSVLRKQMVEVEALFRTTDPSLVTLDAAGRPLFDATIVDAMPKLQGMRESLLETGTIPGTLGGYGFPFQLVSDGFTQWTTWDLSSFFLGGAASKFGEITIDAVAYHDRVMGIPEDANWAWVQQDHPEYLPLESAELGESFVNYSGFTYDRAATYPGCVTYIDKATLTWVVDRILNVVVFNDLGAMGPAAANIAGYAQMADDARAVVYFIHAFESLIDVADPVGVTTCEAQGYTGT